MLPFNFFTSIGFATFAYAMSSFATCKHNTILCTQLISKETQSHKFKSIINSDLFRLRYEIIANELRRRDVSVE